MNGTTFFLSDVFGETKYSGNPLATFFGAGCLAAEEMQRIAREVNFSETTFVLADEPREGGYDVRIFTPGTEVDFAGHPTLGTAFFIREHLIRRPVEEVTLNLKAGKIPVVFRPGPVGEILWMRQVEPVFGDVLDAAPAAAALGISENDLDSRWPVEEVSTGLPHIIVPLQGLDALRRISLDRKGYDLLTGNSRAKVVLAFTAEPRDASHDLSVRVFPVALGISEDPATGSGNGCLAAYLVKHKYFGSGPIDLKAGQGHEIGRPSILYLKAGKKDGSLEVSVGGRVTPVARGVWG